MSFIAKIQNQYDQLWKYIIRPARAPYSEQSLGPSVFTIKEREFHRKDFQLTNKRGYDFSCSLWLPADINEYPCVIYLHCNSSNRIEGTEYLRKLLVNKIALCTFDFSGCGNAEGEYVSLGYHEQDDLEEVINYLKKYPKINNIALWGRSMGAVTTLLYLAKNGKSKGIKAAIVDSPFKSLKTLVECMAQKMVNIPNLLLSGALKIISGTIQQKANFSIYELDPYKVVPTIEVPCFFIVGKKDQMVPVEHTKQLFQAYGGEDKQIRIVKGGHNDNRPKECVREVVRFLLRRLNRVEKKTQLSQKSQESVIQEAQEQNILLIESMGKKQQSRWGSFFSFFNKSQNYKNSKTSQIAKQKIEEVPSKPLKLRRKQTNESLNEQKKILTESQMQDRMRQLTNCYL